MSSPEMGFTKSGKIMTKVQQNNEMIQFNSLLITVAYATYS